MITMNLNKKISMALNVITTIELIAFCCGLIGVDYRLDMIGETNKCLKREYHEKGDRWFEACASPLVLLVVIIFIIF